MKIFKDFYKSSRGAKMYSWIIMLLCFSFVLLEEYYWNHYTHNYGWLELALVLLVCYITVVAIWAIAASGKNTNPRPRKSKSPYPKSDNIYFPEAWKD